MTVAAATHGASLPRTSLLRANPSKDGDAESRDYGDATSLGPPGRQRDDHMVFSGGPLSCPPARPRRAVKGTPSSMPFGFKLSHRLSLTKAALGTAAVRARRTADCPSRRVIHTPQKP